MFVVMGCYGWAAVVVMVYAVIRLGDDDTSFCVGYNQLRFFPSPMRHIGNMFLYNL